MNLEQLSKKELISFIQTLLASNDLLTKKVEQLTKKVHGLEQQVLTLKSKKDSSNSSAPPSHDHYSTTGNKSLRKQSGRKRGGQLGHKGHTLELSQTPDQVIEHQPYYCQGCGEELQQQSGMLKERRQVIDIPPISSACSEHRVFSKTCSCGHVTKGTFPVNVKAPIQYGPGIESMAGYFSVRQYLPYRRMKECFEDLFGTVISEGSLVSAVRRIAGKSQPVYQRIKENILASAVVGADETGAKVNGKKEWFWTWQTPNNTLITVDPSRGFKAVEHTFPDGLTNSILVSDCWAAQLKTPAATHQLCIAHLLRELNFFIEVYGNGWAKDFQELLFDALKLKSKMDNYRPNHPQRNQLIQRLEGLLAYQIDKQPPKIKPFHKRLLKNRDYLFPFLYQREVPPDNNASERAIRNVKVKQKISGQFINHNNARDFAIIRSVIDTAIKNGANVFNSLKLIAKLTPE